MTRRTPRNADRDPRIEWHPAPCLEEVRVMAVTEWSRDLALFHDTLDLCSMDAIDGDRGPLNHYRRWSYEARPRDVLLFEPGYTHRALAGPKASFRVLHVPPALARRAKWELTDRDGELSLTQAVDPNVYSALASLHALLAQDGMEAAAVQEAFVGALELVLSRCCELGRQEAVDDGSVRRALEYIQDFLSSFPDQHLNLDDVVQASGARGKFRLERDFARVTHVGVYEYFKLRKFALAARALLTRPWRRVEHVAWDFGYTANSFSRAFHEVFGVSPRAYRTAFGRGTG